MKFRMEDMNWREFFIQHRESLEAHYPGLTEERFLREAQEIGGDGSEFLQGVPFAYLLGYAEFYGLKIEVDQRVLIPRAETELLTDKVIQWMKTQPLRDWKVVDVCTGSGCIGLAIAANFPTAKVWLADISVEALTLAGDNADRLAPQVNVVQSDLLEEVRGKFDVIVANPPYIPASEQGRSVHQQVDRYEPALALYVPDHGYREFFCQLFSQVRMRLNPGGLFMMEGQPERLEDCAQWARDTGFKTVELEKDWADRVRFLRVHQSP